MNKPTIFVDHGSHQNIGDKAMLFNIIKYLNPDFKCIVVDRSISFQEELSPYAIEMAPDPNTLCRMSYWRLRDYSTQPKILRPILRCYFWLILIARAHQLKSLVLHPRTDYNKTDKKLLQWAAILKKTDAFWVVGGGNLNDIWIENTFWKTIFAEIFHAQNKPVIFSGQGIGPIKHWFTRTLIKRLLRNTSLLSVREKISLESVQSLGKVSEKCHITCDDALSIQTTPFNIRLPSRFIALNLRLGEYAIANDSLFKKYCRLIKKLITLYPEHSFIFIPIALNDADSDISAAKKLIQQIPEYQNKFTILENNLSAGNIKYVLGLAEFNIGVSYHFCLFSLSSGIPTIGIYSNDYYRQKLVGLFEMFGITNSILNLNTNHFDDLEILIKNSLQRFNKSKVLNDKEGMLNRQNTFLTEASQLISSSVNLTNHQQQTLFHD
jgi:polysaccharide pyruvyl transferase WcaK-like protein